MVLSVIWAVAGVIRIGNRQRCWWWVSEQDFLRSKAVVEGNSPEWRSLHTHVRKVRSWRGSVIGGELAAILIGGVLIAAFAPWWAWIIVAAVTMPPLAHAGHPAHLPIFQSAVTTPLVRKISTDVIIRAYAAAGLCNPDPKKPAEHLGFGSIMSRDRLDRGSQVIVYLPYGKTTADAIKAKAQIASGLDVKESQVYITGDPQSERRHSIWIADTDPLAEPGRADTAA